MGRTILFHLGIVLTVIASSIGLVLLPDMQLSNLQPFRDDQGLSHPTAPFGPSYKGRKVYVDLGCVYCHSQQVRPEGFGADIARNWGTRRSVARDTIFDAPHLLGTMRTGPDLMNIGARQPDANWHNQHLFNPTITSPGSVMPRFPFLYEKRKLAPGEPPLADAVRLPPGALAEGFCLIPNERGRDLVAYLQSMNHNYPLPEAQR